MKYVLVIACLFLSVSAFGGLAFQCTPELSGMINPGSYDVAVLASEPLMIGGTIFTIALAPTGPFTWDVPMVPAILPNPVDWQYYEENGVHYWLVSYADPGPSVPPIPPAQLFSMTFGFPEVVHSYELSLLDFNTGETFDYRGFVVAPEPATLAIFALGAVCLRKRV